MDLLVKKENFYFPRKRVEKKPYSSFQKGFFFCRQEKKVKEGKTDIRPNVFILQ